jgi:hypothetical protein
MCCGELHNKSLGDIMLNQVSISVIVVDNDYSITLSAVDDSNISKTIRMPISIGSEDGALISSLINRAWDYIPDAAPDELSQAKARKLQELNSEWTAVEKTGWDSGHGYHLGITPSDVALIVGVFSLAREASAMGLPLPGLISMENNTIEFETIQDMTVLLMYYGKARSDMAKEFAARRKAVEDATTIEEIPVI